MKISKIKINNFRLLKDFELDLEKTLSLVIGKNNSGKTSLIAALNVFLNDKNSSKGCSCDDFNIDFQKNLKEKVEEDQDLNEFVGISVKIFIRYTEKDDLSNLSKVMMDLDPDNKTVVLRFEYSLNEISYKSFKEAYKTYYVIQEEKLTKKYTPKPTATKEEKETLQQLKKEHIKFIFYQFFRQQQSKFFKIYKKSIAFDHITSTENDNEFIDLGEENIRLDKILTLKVINAKRAVSNSNNDKSLSYLSSEYYEKNEGGQIDSPAIQEFKEILSDTDSHLDNVYRGLFKTIIDKVDRFGGIKKGDSIIKIISTLQHRELLKGNTTVMYDHNDEHSLPEHYNGLGYMNLIGMIFELEVIMTDFRKENKKDENPSDINLLIIEEPEAHTHPQMQYVFIKNIKDILAEASEGQDDTKQKFDLQTIITTHSSHITAESDFDDIKYFLRIRPNEIIAKNLKDLEKEYKTDEQVENYKFLKQYLTLNRAELFFADKAIFIEGDTERILLPAMMKKVDQTDKINPMLSQNISVVEVGAYSHVFEKFINFIGIKSLVITDIDGGKEVNKKDKNGVDIKRIVASEISDATHTTNASLAFFHSKETGFNYFSKLRFEHKIRRKSPRNNAWVANRKGNLLVVYQIEETNSAGIIYHGRSFEDSFFHHNKNILVAPQKKFKSLTKKFLKQYLAETIGTFEFVNKAIDSKPSLAMEILLNSKIDGDGNPFSNWEIPEYIKQGLLWLKNN